MNYESTIPNKNLSVLDDFEARSVNRRRLILAALVVVALLLAYVGYHYFMGGAAEEDTASQAPTVTVMVPGKQQVTRTINATGTLAARR
ncbi:MAG: efflux RND transporter periplasmic adaptor subunit, partial [Parasphingorhabdus sp.]